MQFLIDVTLLVIYTFATLLVFMYAWNFWLLYAHQRYMAKIDWVMLEIKLPREIYKSPFAMESVLTALTHTSGIPVWWKRNILGNLPIFSSLEMASIEGVIHFYFRVQRRFRNLIESNLYAQYPGIEISEAEDYTKLIYYHHLSEDVESWSANYPLARKWKPLNPETGQPYKKDGKDYEMKADFLPIKTYVDFGLEKDPKEEFKVDPLGSLFEFMGSMGKGEHLWYQILVQDESQFNNEKAPATYVNEENHEHWTLAEMADRRKRAIRRIKKVKKGDAIYDENGIPKEVTRPKKDGTGAEVVPMVYVDEREIQEKKETQLTQEEKEEIEVINRKLSKPIFRCIVRLIYVAKKEKFNPSFISNIFFILKPFNALDKNHNAFSIDLADKYDFPWENWGNKRVPWRKEERFESYVEREGFFIHIPAREALDKWEDRAFWYFPLKIRKMWRMVYEMVFHPFNHPASDEIICLNAEELASIYHFPGTTVSTPAIPRIDSTKSVAPYNLPQ